MAKFEADGQHEGALRLGTVAVDSVYTTGGVMS
jgi:hypothetical protein